MGLDHAKGNIGNDLEARVIEPAMSKVKKFQVIIYFYMDVLLYWCMCLISSYVHFSPFRFAIEVEITIF